MNAAEPETPRPPEVILLSPTEMADGWAAEVRRKLVEQGFDPELAAKVAGAAEAAAPRFAARPPVWRRLLRFFGLPD